MYAIVGSVPDNSFPLTSEQIRFRNSELSIAGRSIELNRGTPALIGAAIKAGEVLGIEPPTAFLVGDTGTGEGSRNLYAHLEKELRESQFSTLCFHYLQPDADWQYRLLHSIRSSASTPRLIADAGFMYAAKMAGQADEYDLFTPDVGELAFLADEEAPHPFYTRGFILHEEQKLEDLVLRAYRFQNAATYLLIKGEKDTIVQKGKIIGCVDSPKTEALEAIGGTGDTLTGLVTALIASGFAMDKACVLACKTNRLAGFKARPDPASQIISIIKQIPLALEEILRHDNKTKA
jgi:ADP-dependent NAD(P)H-hydrate dehydratase / NAD(P)H-hydrate epimerase